MNDHRDRLIDMLLREVVGGEIPPDMRSKIMAKAARLPVKPVARKPRPPTGRVPSYRPVFTFLARAAVPALLAAGAGIFFLWQIERDRTPVLTSATGVVNGMKAKLSAGDRLMTGTDSRAVLTYADGTEVVLGADTTLLLSAHGWLDRAKALELVQGSLKASVAPQRVGHAMVLHGGKVRLEVVGTRFSFQHDESRTRLEVGEGEVRFVSEDKKSALPVIAGHFAEVNAAGMQTGVVHAAPPRRGIVKFTLMNADTDEPLREGPLTDGETISLGSLPTRNLNLRAEYEGEVPASVNISVTRDDGQPTGVPSAASKDQTEPPFFVAGDHWSDGRPHDCRAWTPTPGHYRLSATATYGVGNESRRSQPLNLSFGIAD